MYVFLVVWCTIARADFTGCAQETALEESIKKIMTEHQRLLAEVPSPEPSESESSSDEDDDPCLFFQRLFLLKPKLTHLYFFVRRNQHQTQLFKILFSKSGSEKRS